MLIVESVKVVLKVMGHEYDPDLSVYILLVVLGGLTALHRIESNAGKMKRNRRQYGPMTERIIRCVRSGLIFMLLLFAVALAALAGLAGRLEFRLDDLVFFLFVVIVVRISVAIFARKKSKK